MSASAEENVSTTLSVPDKLTEWGLSQYISAFEAHAIDEKKFVTVTAANVKELIPILGHRMEFIEQRLIYLKSKGLKDPDELFCDLDDTVSIISLTDSNSTSSSISSAPIVAEASKPDTGEQLRRLLRKTPKGEALLKSIRLTSHDRKKLCDIVVDHLMIAKEKIKTTDWQFWAKEIVTVFAHEQEETYYTPYQSRPNRRLASGKLWDKYCNIRRYIRTKLSATGSTTNDPPGAVPDEIQNALVKLRAISPQDEDLKRLWLLTSQHRSNDGSIVDYYNKYPVLFSTIGSSLLEIDFEEARLTDPNILITSWAAIATKIISFAKHKGICEDLFRDQATAETLGFLVLPYLFRTSRIPTKRGTNWRPSQAEVAKAFIMQIPTAGDYERVMTERQTTLAKYGVTVQPFVLTIGSKTSYTAVYVVVDTTKYQCSSLMGAVDLCFKVIWALRAHYQAECEPVWNFIQRFVYLIRDNTISNKNSQTIQTVWSDVIGFAQANN